VTCSAKDGELATEILEITFSTKTEVLVQFAETEVHLVGRSTKIAQWYSPIVTALTLPLT